MGIFRGIGGTGNSTDDGVVDAVTAQAVIATNKATEAANSATSAYNDAQSASTSKDTAITQANAAQASANTASTHATNASTSATSAATSATSATASATTATTKASEAATSATNAATSETNAATSATTATTKASEAATSATTATTKAGEASTSATNAASSATSASTSASTATTKASEASTSAASAASSYDDFDDRYLGAKSSAPTLDNDGDALITGALYFDTTSDSMKVYSGSAWLDAYASLSGALIATNNLSDLNNVSTARTNLGLGTAATTASTDYATAAQGTTADNALPKSGGAMTGAITTNSTFDGRNVSADGAKLDGIEAGATADQTAGEIKTAYESNADTNAFTDADHTKLDGIEAGADVTDTANVTAAGALMDSELTSEASVKALNQGVATTDSPSFAGLTVDTDTLSVDATNNRVGIGTTSPTEALHISKPSSAVIHLQRNDSTTGSAQIKGLGSDGTVDGKFVIYGNTLQFFTDDSSERMRINSSGRVGIGTSSPSAKLEIEDTDFARLDLNLSNATGTTIADVRGLVAGTEKWRIGKTASSSDDFAINVTGSERVRIDSSGRVGIGTSSPAQELHVKGSGEMARLESTSATGNTWMTFHSPSARIGYFGYGSANDTHLRIVNDTSGDILASTNGSERIRIDSSGNVGIADSTPSAKLDVNGAVLLQGGTFTAGIDSGTAGIVLQQDKPIFSRDVNGNYLRNLLKHGSGGRIELGQTGTALITGIDLKAGSSGHIKVHSRVTSNNADLELRRNDSGYSFKLATDGSGIIIRHTGNSYNAGFQTRYWYGNTMLSNSGSTGTAYGVLVSSSNLYPAQSGVSGLYRDNAVDLGHSSARWDDVYATNGTIQTSDEREKQDIEALNEAEQRVAVAAKGLLRKFRWKDKVAAKGDDARIHFGIIAQDLEAAFIAEGLDPSRYAMFIKTEWWVGDKVYPAVEEETDEEGNVITEAVEESIDPEHHYDNQTDAPDDAVYHYRMGIRYSELLAFIISAI